MGRRETRARLPEQSAELRWGDSPVALGHEFSDLFPVRIAGEKDPDAIAASSSRSEERVADGQQRLAFVGVGTQHDQGDGLAGR